MMSTYPRYSPAKSGFLGGSAEGREVLGLAGGGRVVGGDGRFLLQAHMVVLRWRCEGELEVLQLPDVDTVHARLLFNEDSTILVVPGHAPIKTFAGGKPWFTSARREEVESELHLHEALVIWERLVTAGKRRQSRKMLKNVGRLGVRSEGIALTHDQAAQIDTYSSLLRSFRRTYWNMFHVNDEALRWVLTWSESKPVLLDEEDTLSNARARSVFNVVLRCGVPGSMEWVYEAVPDLPDVLWNLITQESPDAVEGEE